MSMFTFAIPFDHFQCALIHGTNIIGSYAVLLFIASDFTSITSHIHNLVCFHFGSISSFFLELFLRWSPIVYWGPTNLGSSSFSILSFCLFMLFHGVLMLFVGFSRQEYWSGLPFPSPVDHILSELSKVVTQGIPWGSQVRTSTVWVPGLLRFFTVFTAVS